MDDDPSPLLIFFNERSSIWDTISRLFLLFQLHLLFNETIPGLFRCLHGYENATYEYIRDLFLSEDRTPYYKFWSNYKDSGMMTLRVIYFTAAFTMLSLIFFTTKAVANLYTLIIRLIFFSIALTFFISSEKMQLDVPFYPSTFYFHLTLWERSCLSSALKAFCACNLVFSLHHHHPLDYFLTKSAESGVSVVASAYVLSHFIVKVYHTLSNIIGTEMRQKNWTCILFFMIVLTAIHNRICFISPSERVQLIYLFLSWILIIICHCLRAQIRHAITRVQDGVQPWSISLLTIPILLVFSGLVLMYLRNDTMKLMKLHFIKRFLAAHLAIRSYILIAAQLIAPANLWNTDHVCTVLNRCCDFIFTLALLYITTPFNSDSQTDLFRLSVIILQCWQCIPTWMKPQVNQFIGILLVKWRLMRMKNADEATLLQLADICPICHCELDTTAEIYRNSKITREDGGDDAAAEPIVNKSIQSCIRYALSTSAT
ncbi:Nucleoid occlusion factor SlmA [Trichinella spiralis]|uniref:Nucleoid occlusion factor SlmA n=1 Tax=Trichinella spiralis TaxID=6334 RepID=A0ABR3L2W6_TRISP